MFLYMMLSVTEMYSDLRVVCRSSAPLDTFAFLAKWVGLVGFKFKTGGGA